MSDIQNELDVLIRARYPILYLVSWEEPRVMRTLRQIARKQDKELLTWTVTDGWTNADGAPPAPPGTSDRRASSPAPRRTRSATVEVDQALDALDAVEQWDSRTSRARGALFVLKDFDPYITAPAVERRLRDLAMRLPYAGYKTLLIVSPVLKVPSHLDKDITVVDIDLPGYDDLKVILDRITASVAPESVLLEGEDKEAFIKAALGLTSAEAENVFAKALVMDGKLEHLDIQVVLQEKKQIVRKSGTLEYYESEAKFGDIGGLSALKDWLRKRRDSLTDRAREFGLPEPNGALLIGVQGCGKSLAAKAVGALWQMPTLRFDIGSVFGRYVGESEQNMRKAIATAEAVAPCVLWIDELEKGFSGMTGGEDSGTSARVLSYFLTWLQEKKKPVFVIATANDVQKLPPELLRKGRLDEIFFIDLPAFKERVDIFAIHLRLRNRDPEKFDLERLATVARGYSGAEIEQAVVAALFDAFDQNRDINTDDVVKAIEVAVPISRTMAERITALREWADERARPASFPEDLSEPDGTRIGDAPVSSQPARQVPRKPRVSASAAAVKPEQPADQESQAEPTTPSEEPAPAEPPADQK